MQGCCTDLLNAPDLSAGSIISSLPVLMASSGSEISHSLSERQKLAHAFRVYMPI